jgi:dihydropteroate synthase
MTDAAATLARLLGLGRPLVMGILNVTPDSFSDGGAFDDPARAVAHARTMIEQGADIIDIGAESTRPYVGAAPVSLDEEMARLAGVVPAVVALGVPVSIDTIKSPVADWALGLGAAIANDVWGLQRDPEMAQVVARRRVPVVVMHNRHEVDPSLDIIDDMISFFTRSLAIAAASGIPREAVMLDPGIGFGKTPEQSMTALARLDAFKSFGLPILVGASRKRFINTVTPSTPQQRLPGSLASHLLAVAGGATVIRTHDVAETLQALRVDAAIRSRR